MPADMFNINKPTANGHSTPTPTPNVRPDVAAPLAPVYTTSTVHPADIKSPQLPFGENVAVATGVTGL